MIMFPPRGVFGHYYKTKVLPLFWVSFPDLIAENAANQSQ